MWGGVQAGTDYSVRLGGWRESNGRNRGSMRAVWVALCSSFWFVLQGVLQFSGPHFTRTRRNYVIGDVFIFIGIACIGWAFYRRRQLLSQLDAPVQLRLGPQGFCQREGLGRPLYCQWDEVSYRLRQKGSRMRITLRKQSFLMAKVILADFDFDCDPAMGRRIEKYIREWHGAARNKTMVAR